MPTGGQEAVLVKTLVRPLVGLLLLDGCVRVCVCVPVLEHTTKEKGGPYSEMQQNRYFLLAQRPKHLLRKIGGFEGFSCNSIEHLSYAQ